MVVVVLGGGVLCSSKVKGKNGASGKVGRGL